MSGGLIWLAFTYVFSKSTLNIEGTVFVPLGFETIPNTSLNTQIVNKPHHVERCDTA